MKIYRQTIDLVIKGRFLLAASSSASAAVVAEDFSVLEAVEAEVVAAASEGTAPSGTETCNSPEDEFRTITWVRFVPLIVTLLCEISFGVLASGFLVSVDPGDEQKWVHM